eukprot:ANDGO_04501.mRNA.1 hypothetical protein
MDAFRAAEKLYRSASSLEDRYIATHFPKLAFEREPMGVSDMSIPKVRCSARFPGLYIVRNALSPSAQLEIMKKAFMEYCSPPNDTNLHAHYSSDRLQQLWKDACDVYACEKKEKGQIHDASKRPLLELLRWSTLGIRYDWSARKYDFGSNDRQFPADVAALCDSVAKVCLGNDFTFRAEAGIMNYYVPNSQLCGHVDDAELAFDAPIVSLSLGNSCIFLAGGDSKDVEPDAFVLRSGDAVVMHGASRRCYHGVAKIFSGTLPAFLLPQNVPDDSSCCRKLAEFWKDMRINVNARQVFPSPEPALPVPDTSGKPSGIAAQPGTQTASQMAARLQLISHDEGGWFRQTYETTETVSTPDRIDGVRPAMNTIYYMLTGIQSIGHLHSNMSDIMHYYHGGNPILYVVLNEAHMTLERFVMGSDAACGQVFQLLVPANLVKASVLLHADGSIPTADRPLDPEEWGLISEVVAPGFDYRDRQLLCKPSCPASFQQLLHSSVGLDLFHK